LVRRIYVTLLSLTDIGGVGATGLFCEISLVLNAKGPSTEVPDPF
jgi:hypothetical protein